MTAASHLLVVAAASRHGATTELADRVARQLAESLPPGWTVSRRPVDRLGDLDEADALVLGSAVYFGRWMRPARRALTRARRVPDLPVWIFSTGPVDDETARDARTMAAGLHAHDVQGHRVFGGRLDPTELNPVERLVVRLAKVPAGDYRDWDAVGAWAHDVATTLKQRAGSPAPPPPTRRAGE